ncbi:hypothetical protein I3W98_38660, partial [Streptomyces cavourensis]|nr:hypothetical protein [Streptomyces cavourensis]
LAHQFRTASHQRQAGFEVVAAQDRGRTVPAAIVTLRREATAEDLLRRANAALDRAGQPRLALLEIAPTPEAIPLGPTGKVLKRQLREKYAALEEYRPADPKAVAVTAAVGHGTTEALA